MDIHKVWTTLLMLATPCLNLASSYHQQFKQETIAINRQIRSKHELKVVEEV